MLRREFRLNSRRQVVFCKNTAWLPYSMIDLLSQRKHRVAVNICAQLQHFLRFLPLNHLLSLCTCPESAILGYVDSPCYSQGDFSIFVRFK
jgi:hypothetical protein